MASKTSKKDIEVMTSHIVDKVIGQLSQEYPVRIGWSQIFYINRTTFLSLRLFFRLILFFGDEVNDSFFSDKLVVTYHIVSIKALSIPSKTIIHRQLNNRH